MIGRADSIWIVGQGLAGSVLAWQLKSLGVDVRLSDADEPITCSKIAAGLLTPITGQRLALSWRAGEFFPAAAQFYQALERWLGRRFFHEVPIYRLFNKAEELAKWQTRAEDQAFLPFVEKASWEGTELAPWVEACWGGVVFKGAWLDVPAFVQATKDEWFSQGKWEGRRIAVEEARDWAGEKEGRRVIFCEGAAARLNKYLHWIEWKAAKGDILDLWIDPSWGLPEDRLYSGGVWLQSRGQGFWRTGSNYVWDQLDTQPTAEGSDSILQRLRRWLKVPIHLIGHRAAVRPIIRESKALCGLLPAQGMQRIGLFNGLGSKGSLHAPWAANQLASHLVHGTPLDQEIDLCR